MDQISCPLSHKDRLTLLDQPDLSQSAKEALEKGELWDYVAQGKFYEVKLSEQDAREIVVKCQVLGLGTTAQDLRMELNLLESRRRQ